MLNSVDETQKKIEKDAHWFSNVCSGFLIYIDEKVGKK